MAKLFRFRWLGSACHNVTGSRPDQVCLVWCQTKFEDQLTSNGSESVAVVITEWSQSMAVTA
jgi:hypothetical protein